MTPLGEDEGEHLAVHYKHPPSSTPQWFLFIYRFSNWILNTLN